MNYRVQIKCTAAMHQYIILTRCWLLVFNVDITDKINTAEKI